MQIVIDIDENLYTRLFDNGVDNYDVVDIAKAIRRGTPLPKGHGRLKDIEVLDDLFFEATDYPNAKLSYEEISDILLNAPTIIEADKAESEVK